ncbi:hypothetical protein ATCV1_z383R [Acanthocystis turfacea chlorella virus 1]|uniref:Uncharacterized protein z383R n=1 Tax=Chlorovirus heliozoae TaxID=322019 RepID=A7K8Z3_9PHYC|nr:hypothetical protein ATCV1_z383R [Acanthocystis turfacea chlorella virus 1]ABT16517.1 hypothetical protein ATCV1_z383R [Acanthocystis turfacea chlorella virus 1]
MILTWNSRRRSRQRWTSSSPLPWWTWSCSTRFPSPLLACATLPTRALTCSRRSQRSWLRARWSRPIAATRTTRPRPVCC